MALPDYAVVDIGVNFSLDELLNEFSIDFAARDRTYEVTGGPAPKTPVLTKQAINAQLASTRKSNTKTETANKLKDSIKGAESLRWEPFKHSQMGMLKGFKQGKQSLLHIAHPDQLSEILHPEIAKGLTEAPHTDYVVKESPKIPIHEKFMGAASRAFNGLEEWSKRTNERLRKPWLPHLPKINLSELPRKAVEGVLEHGIVNPAKALGRSLINMLPGKESREAEVSPGHYNDKIKRVYAELEPFGIKEEVGKNLWSSKLNENHDLRSHAIGSPELFDARIDRILYELGAAQRVTTNPNSRRAIGEKLSELSSLKREVQQYRLEKKHKPATEPFGVEEEAPEPFGLAPLHQEMPKPTEEEPITEGLELAAPHRGRKGAGLINLGAALKHLSEGGNRHSAVKHLMDFGGLSKQSAQRKVREAYKHLESEEEAELKWGKRYADLPTATEIE